MQASEATSSRGAIRLCDGPPQFQHGRVGGYVDVQRRRHLDRIELDDAPQIQQLQSLL
jgi:hypothetical protein